MGTGIGLEQGKTLDNRDAAATPNVLSLSSLPLPAQAVSAAVSIGLLASVPRTDRLEPESALRSEPSSLLLSSHIESPSIALTGASPPSLLVSHSEL